MCLESGRAAFERREWANAHRLLTAADVQGELDAADLELLAATAHLLGREGEHLAALERAQRAHRRAGRPGPAARCAFWLGVGHASCGEHARASGWLARAQRLLATADRPCVEEGYGLLVVVLRDAAAGAFAEAHAAAAEAAAIAARFDEPDLLALAVHEQGHALIGQGRVDDGLALLDEAMVAVVAGELSPVVTGLLYCSVIGYCQEAFALRRAGEWTTALARWCDAQPDLVAFTGTCLVHRAEIMQLSGAWTDALEAARGAAVQLARQRGEEDAAAPAVYRQAELLRVQGALGAAEEAYLAASRCGWEPQPGLALLRLAQGRGAEAAAALRRALAETSAPPRRAALLPAAVEVLLAAGRSDEAREACAELEALSERHPSELLAALAAQARGATMAAAGDAVAALVALRRALGLWLALRAPYEAARTRVLIAGACRALGDTNGAELELGAARDALAALGASADLARLDAGAAPAASHGLTGRELQVLRLVAAGRTNRGIAAELVLSERTVDRHVSNILTKLRVSSRTAATAYAFAHDLL